MLFITIVHVRNSPKIHFFLKMSETWIQKPAMLLWKLHVSPTLAKGLVQQGENGALPEGVAAVHQFIGASLEATLVGHLLVDRPLQETWRPFPTLGDVTDITIGYHWLL